MRHVLAAALAVAVAAPATSENSWYPWEQQAFFHAMYDSGVKVTTSWRSAFELHRCNVAASKKIGTERTGVALVGLPIETEAAEAMAACTSEVDALAKVAPATEVEAIKAAIVRANVKTIQEMRSPRGVACASEINASMCWMPWRR